MKNCKICDSSNFKNLLEFDKIIFSDGSHSNNSLIKKECLSCGTIATDLDIDLDKFYKEYYTPSRNIDTVVVINNEESNRSQFIYQWILELDSNIENSHSMMEIGCGQGFLLKLFNIKNKYAIEPSKDAYKISSNIAKVRNIGFESIKDSEHYDFLLSYCVIEHLSDPKEFLEKAYNILENDGTMCIALPIQDKFNYDIFFADHLHHFNHKTFITLLLNNGFEVINYDLGKGSYFNIAMYICKKTNHLSHQKFNYIKNNNIINISTIEKNMQYIESTFRDKKIYAFGYGEIAKTILPYSNLDSVIEKYVDDFIIDDKVINTKDMKKILLTERITMLILVNPIHIDKIKDLFIEFNNIEYITLFDNINLELL